MDMHSKDLRRAGGPRCVSLVGGPAQILGVLDAEHAAQGVSLIALINGINRLAVITRRPGGKASAWRVRDNYDSLLYGKGRHELSA